MRSLQLSEGSTLTVTPRLVSTNSLISSALKSTWRLPCTANLTAKLNQREILNSHPKNTDHGNSKLLRNITTKTRSSLRICIRNRVSSRTNTQECRSRYNRKHPSEMYITLHLSKTNHVVQVQRSHKQQEVVVVVNTEMLLLH